MIVNLFLAIMIIIEAISVAIVYYPIYGNQGILASCIYLVIALVHIVKPTKQLSTVVLILSLAIAIPRILITIEQRIEARQSEAITQLEHSRPIPPEQPILSSCNLFASWDTRAIRDCQLHNEKALSAHANNTHTYQAQLAEYQDRVSVAKHTNQLTLSDMGGLLMFFVMFSALPIVIYYLLLSQSEIATLNHTQKTQDEIVSQALAMYKEKIPVSTILKELDYKISRTTLYKYVRRKKNST